jgi:Kdo2-lipid IVA lauroyltransferase/acyltransferase
VAKYYFFPRELAKRQPRLTAIGWRLEAGVIRSLMWLLGRLPLARATALARAVFGAFGPHTQTARRVRRNLTVAFPERSAPERRQLVHEIFGNLGVTLAEIAQLDRIWAERAQRMDFVAAPEIEFLRHPGRPAVLVSAHVSAYTLTNFVAGAYNFPLTTVYLPESNPYVRDLILRLYSALPVAMKPRDSSMRSLIGELTHGRTVGLASDVRLDSGELLPFFGHDMAANTVPARLALRYRCELVPARAERLPGGRYRITLYAPVRPEDSSVSEAEQARNMTLQLNRHYEAWIRANPGEWMCLARRWSKDIERVAEQAVLQKPS